MNNTGFINFTKNSVPREFTLQGNALNKHIETKIVNLVNFYFRKESSDTTITDFKCYRCVFDENFNVVNTETIDLDVNFLTVTSTHIYCDLKYWFWGTEGRYYFEITTNAGNIYYSDIVFTAGEVSEIYLLTEAGEYILTENNEYIIYE